MRTGSSWPTGAAANFSWNTLAETPLRFVDLSAVSVRLTPADGRPRVIGSTLHISAGALETRRLEHTAGDLCKERGGKTFVFRTCELTLDIAEDCSGADATCPEGKDCIQGRCFFPEGDEPGVCCNFQDEHYEGIVDDTFNV